MKALTLGLALLASAAPAQELALPGNAVSQFTKILPDTDLAVPVGPWADGAVETRTATGQRDTTVWRIAAPGLTSLQLIRPLRDQLRDAGFSMVFECETNACGGFDFRFAIPVTPPPAMQVNLGDFRFLSAQNTQTDTWVTVFASRTARAGYIQIIRIGAGSTQAPETLGVSTGPSLRATAPLADTDFGRDLETIGHVLLGDLVFDSGSAQLSDGEYASLVALADYLLANPTRQIALVGHTDASGGLDANIALSKRRAAAVMERLVRNHGVPRAQLDAQGMGYLSPVTTNLTPEGREANRRVEAIITSIQ